MKRMRGDNHADCHSDGAACTNTRRQRRMIFRACASTPAAAAEPMATMPAASSNKLDRNAAEVADTAITQRWQGGPMMQGAVTGSSGPEERSMRLSWADYVRSKEGEGINVLSDKNPPSDAAADCSAEARSDYRAMWVEQCAIELMEKSECEPSDGRASFEKAHCTRVDIPDLNLPACDDFGLAAHCQGVGFMQGEQSSNASPARNTPGLRAHGTPGLPAHNTPGLPAHGTPGLPAHGTPGLPAHGTPGLPAHVTPGLPAYNTHGLPAYGTHGLPAHSIPGVRGAESRGSELCELSLNSPGLKQQQQVQEEQQLQQKHLGVPVTARRTSSGRRRSWRQAMVAPMYHHALYSPFVTHSQRCASSYIHVSAAQANVTHENAQSPPVAEPPTTPEAHAQTPPAVSAWPAVSAAFSGEWAGYSVDFSRFGQPLELPQSVVPEAFRDWGLVQYAWQSQTSSVARGETLGNAKILSSFVRYAPAAGCEAASPPKYSVERTVLELSAAPAAAAAAAAGELFAFTEDGSYLLVRAGQSSTMPAPASVDAMRATQWVPRGIDSTARDSNERDSDGGIRSMAAGPFQVEHCLALEGVEAASGKGRVRVRVVQEFAPQTAAAGGRGGNRGGGALALPRLASLAMHREKWVEPFSGGAELADGAALFSSEMIEEGEGSEAVREGRVKEIEGRWEVTAREAQVPTAVSHVHKVDELSGESLFHVEVGWLFSSNQAIVSRANFDQSGNAKSLSISMERRFSN
ncbi:unnamed protein product [Closterium sp. NIES-54]